MASATRPTVPREQPSQDSPHGCRRCRGRPQRTGNLGGNRRRPRKGQSRLCLSDGPRCPGGLPRRHPKEPSGPHDRIGRKPRRGSGRHTAGGTGLDRRSARRNHELSAWPSDACLFGGVGDRRDPGGRGRFMRTHRRTLVGGSGPGRLEERRAHRGVQSRGDSARPDRDGLSVQDPNTSSESTPPSWSAYSTPRAVSGAAALPPSISAISPRDGSTASGSSS